MADDLNPQSPSRHPSRLTAADLLGAFARVDGDETVNIEPVEVARDGFPSVWRVRYSGFPGLGGDRSLTAVEAVSLAGDMARIVRDAGNIDPFSATRFFIACCAAVACEALAEQAEACRLPGDRSAPDLRLMLDAGVAAAVAGRVQ